MAGAQGAGEITVHCLAGAIDFTSEGTTRLLLAGQLLYLPGGMLHFNDFDLFYQNIRINAVARTDAWLVRDRRKN